VSGGRPNDGFDYSGQVDRKHHGVALLDYLVDRYRHSDASAWRQRIADGRVTVDRQSIPAGTALKYGQRVVWRRPPWVEPAAPLRFAVLHQDKELLAVNKPAGLPTLPGGGFLQHTLLHQVRLQTPGASPLHRLGRFTSGVVLFARSVRAHSGLSHQFAAREVHKRYRALATGRPELDAWEIDAPIGPVAHPLLGSVHAAVEDPERGKPSISRVFVVERHPDGEAFLCDVVIATGRPHQIRIHLAVAGHPLLGDPLYGPGGRPPAGCRALPGDPGYLLHAAEIRFRHPVTGGELTVDCPPPDRLRSWGQQP